MGEVMSVVAVRRDSHSTASGVRFRDGASSRKTSKVKLNWRGRVAVVLLAVVSAWTLWSVAVPESAHSQTGPTQVVSYTVQPGDTLWSYAVEITPAGQDVSQSVDRLMKLNNLDTVSLRPGQRLIVPVE